MAGAGTGLTFRHTIGDVGTLHRADEYSGAVFQAASQFNCLEMVGPRVRPEDGVTCYWMDRTQGPTCALACPAGTVYRNYFVNGVGQAGPDQIDLLLDVGDYPGNTGAGAGAGEQYWTTQNGYALPVGSGRSSACRSACLTILRWRPRRGCGSE